MVHNLGNMAYPQNNTVYTQIQNEQLFSADLYQVVQLQIGIFYGQNEAMLYTSWLVDYHSNLFIGNHFAEVYFEHFQIKSSLSGNFNSGGNTSIKLRQTLYFAACFNAQF